MCIKTFALVILVACLNGVNCLKPMPITYDDCNQFRQGRLKFRALGYVNERLMMLDDRGTYYSISRKNLKVGTRSVSLTLTGTSYAIDTDWAYTTANYQDTKSYFYYIYTRPDTKGHIGLMSKNGNQTCFYEFDLKIHQSRPLNCLASTAKINSAQFLISDSNEAIVAWGAVENVASAKSPSRLFLNDKLGLDNGKIVDITIQPFSLGTINVTKRMSGLSPIAAVNNKIQRIVLVIADTQVYLVQQAIDPDMAKTTRKFKKVKPLGNISSILDCPASGSTGADMDPDDRPLEILKIVIAICCVAVIGLFFWWLNSQKKKIKALVRGAKAKVKALTGARGVSQPNDAKLKLLSPIMKLKAKQKFAQETSHSSSTAPGGSSPQSSPGKANLSLYSLPSNDDQKLSRFSASGSKVQPPTSPKNTISKHSAAGLLTPLSKSPATSPTTPSSPKSSVSKTLTTLRQKLSPFAAKMKKLNTVAKTVGKAK